MTIIRLIVVSLALAALAPFAAAQGYPDKPIRVLVPVPAGGTPDVLARNVTPALSDLLGQPLVIDNRGGAGGGLPFALPMAYLAGLLEFLPSLGHAIWLLIASILALFAGSTWLPIPNWAFILVVIGLHIFFEQFDLNYLIPRVIGQRVRLPPLVVILGIVAGAVLAGVIGILLAAPTIASARVLGSYVYANLTDSDPFPDSIVAVLPPPNPRWGVKRAPLHPPKRDWNRKTHARDSRTHQAAPQIPESSPKWSSNTKMVIGIAVIALFAAMLVQFRQIIGPLLLAFILAFLLHPLANRLSAGSRLSWRIAVNLIYLSLIIILAGVITVAIEAVHREDASPFIYPQASTIRFDFAARGAMPPVEVVWRDGVGNRPPLPPQLGPDATLTEEAGKFIYTRDLVFKGGTHGNTLRIVPATRMQEMAAALPRVPSGSSDHATNFVRACQGREESRSPFRVAGPLTQVFLLGIVAQRLGGRLTFDVTRREFVGTQAANDLLRGPPPRAGWEAFWRRSFGRTFSENASTPTPWSPMALMSPPAVSTSRGGGLPSRGLK